MTVWCWYSEYVLNVCHKNNLLPHIKITFRTAFTSDPHLYYHCQHLHIGMYPPHDSSPPHPHNGNINACQNVERISKRETKPLGPKSPTHLNYTSNIPRLVFFLYIKYFSGVCWISTENYVKMDSKQQMGFLLSWVM